MDIVKESIDNLSAVVKIKVGPADYQDRVDTQIKKYQKDARIPGFRPGKIPAGMIQKMYGKSILADEVNRLLNDSLYKYLTDNKIEILGNPMPKDDANIDFENTKEWEFLYEVGLAPTVKVELSPKQTFDYYAVAVDEKLLDKYVTDIRRRYGKFSNPELAEATDIIYGEFAELNSDGTEKEGGIKTTTTLAIELVQDATEGAKLVGAKLEDVIVFNPAKAIDNATELAAMLNTTKDNASNLTSDFKLTVKTINRVEKAELNQELFDRLFGEGKINSEEEFFNHVKEDIAKIFTNDSDRKLRSEIVAKLIADVNPKLPDEFLKRWLMAVNEKPLTKEQLEAEYPEYAKGLKWRLIENTIIKNNDIQVTADDAKEHVRAMVYNQFAQYGQAGGLDNETLEKIVNNYLAKEEQARKVYESIVETKVFDLLKSTFTLKSKSLAYDEFVKVISAA